MMKFLYSHPLGHELPQFQAIRLLATFSVLIFLCEYLIRFNGWLVPQIEFHIHGFAPNEFLSKGIAIFLTAYFSLIIFNSSFILFEIRKIERSNMLKRYLRGFLFQSVSLPIIIVISYPVFMLRKWVGFEPLVSMDSLGAMIMIYPMVFLLVNDLFGYWLHRAQHKFDFLWRFHLVHHGIEDLNTWNSYHHFGELFWAQIFNILTLSLLLDDPATGIAFVTAFFARNGNFVHSDSPTLSLPPALRHILVDNIYHHYHHARDPRFHDTNFAAHFSFIDRIFGTQTLPKDYEFPVTGVEGYRKIETIPDYLSRPFVKTERSEVLLPREAPESVSKL